MEPFARLRQRLKQCVVASPSRLLQPALPSRFGLLHTLVLGNAIWRHFCLLAKAAGKGKPNVERYYSSSAEIHATMQLFDLS